MPYGQETEWKLLWLVPEAKLLIQAARQLAKASPKQERSGEGLASSRREDTPTAPICTSSSHRKAEAEKPVTKCNCALPVQLRSAASLILLGSEYWCRHLGLAHGSSRRVCRAGCKDLATGIVTWSSLAFGLSRLA